ncbi:MAG TPA: MazG-like family protein [Patescibacteria group bacterium]|nr:MazG-like family protein [Patescibacteria group bacterium]
MNLKNLEERIKNLHSEIKPRYKVYTNEEKDILYNTVKLNEEVGELCNDILAILKLQRKSKLAKFDKRNIYEEFADVLITTIILAVAAGVDIERALNEKLEKIEERYRRENKKI